MDLELAGKVVLITGGTDGLGLALAKRLAAEGAAVAVCGRDEERAGGRRGRAEEVGGDVLAQQADVTQAGGPRRLRRSRRGPLGPDRRGRPQCRARLRPGPIESIDDATWESDFQLKLMAAVRLTRLALPAAAGQPRAPSSSRWPWRPRRPVASSEPSSVTRAAGMALMKALSKELAADGVRVNAVLIGLIESGQWVRAAEGAGTGLAAVLRPLRQGRGASRSGRFGRAEEFADLGCFLLSPRASYLTGVAINLDGGLSPAV